MSDRKQKFTGAHYCKIAKEKSQKEAERVNKDKKLHNFLAWCPHPRHHRY